jgi:pimeloyl-ACP methyl ester carboxylesterase
MARFLHRPINQVERSNFLKNFILADYEATLGILYISLSPRAITVMLQFAKKSVSTLLISGEKDIIISAEMERVVAELIRNIQYVKIVYFPILENRKTYLENVQKFLEV